MGTFLATASKPSLPSGRLGTWKQNHPPEGCGPQEIKWPWSDWVHALCLSGLSCRRLKRFTRLAGKHLNSQYGNQPVWETILCSRAVCGLWEDRRLSFHFFPSHITGMKTRTEHSVSGSPAASIMIHSVGESDCQRSPHQHVTKGRSLSSENHRKPGLLARVATMKQSCTKE